MNVNLTLKNELQHLAASGAAGAQNLRLTTPSGVIDIHLAAVDRLACAVETLTFESDRLAKSAVDELKQLSDRLSKKICYLLEPISLIECDADSATVQMRSNPPQKNDDQTSYYEVVARRGGSITLCRYVKQPGDIRQMTPAHLTHEVVARLAQDFVDAV